MFKSKQTQVEGAIGDYCQTVMACLQALQKGLRGYCENPEREEARAAFERVHRAESRADDIRREIEVLIYRKALFPESRGDILGLLETMDRVPNQAESAVRMIWNQRVEIPKELHGPFTDLVDICVRTAAAMVEAVQKVFSDYVTAMAAVGRIDQLESEADKIESALIDMVFTSAPEAVSSLKLRDLVHHVAGVSDRAENVGDRIRIMVAKRSV